MLYTKSEEQFLLENGFLVAADSSTDDQWNQLKNIKMISELGNQMYGKQDLNKFFMRLKTSEQQREFHAKYHTAKKTAQKAQSHKENQNYKGSLTQRSSAKSQALSQSFLNVDEKDWISEFDTKEEKQSQIPENWALSKSQNLMNQKKRGVKKTVQKRNTTKDNADKKSEVKNNQKQNPQKGQKSQQQSQAQISQKKVKEASKHLTQPVRNFKRKTLQEVEQKRKKQQESINELLSFSRKQQTLKSFYEKNKGHIPVYDKRQIIEGNKTTLTESYLREKQQEECQLFTFKPQVDSQSSRIIEQQKVSFQERQLKDKSRREAKGNKILKEVMQSTPFKPKLNEASEWKAESKIKKLWTQKGQSQSALKGKKSRLNLNNQKDIDFDLFTFSEELQDLADLQGFDNMKGLSQSMIRTGSFFSDDFNAEESKVETGFNEKRAQREEIFTVRVDHKDKQLFIGQ